MHMDMVWTLLKAFLVGGAICAVGQILIDLTKLTPARILVGFVVVGVVLGALGLYDPLVQWAGAGASVPLTGFGNTMVQGTKEVIQKEGLMGVITGPWSASAAGVTVALLCGLVMSVVTKPKEK